MKQLLVKPILKILLLSITFSVSAQDINIDTRTEHIQIINDTLFHRKVTVLIKPGSEESVFPIFHDFELETISDIEVFVKKGNRFKLLKKPDIFDTDIEVELISSKKLKSIVIPPETEVKINYTVSCSDLKYFADLPFFSYNNIDTIDYQVSLPGTYRLFYDILHMELLENLAIDSTINNNQTIWHFRANPVKVEPDMLMYFGIYRDLKAPFIRIAVVPTAFGDNKVAYFNDWYRGEVAKTRGLDSAAKNKIDEITDGITDSMKIISTLYDYVRTNFKYVAIEIGMGAFIPSHVNEVFVNKQGDCKDLSNFFV